MTSIAAAASDEFPTVRLSVNNEIYQWISRHSHGEESGKVINEIGSVIFPDSKWIKVWDAVSIVLLVGLAFIIPYQIGVSAGIYLVTDLWWFIVNVIVNTFFLVDTFLYFWRAYRDEEGRLVFNLRRIRRRYLKTYFIPNLLGNFPSTILFYFTVRYKLENGGVEARTVILLQCLNLFKLFRFFRVKTIVKASSVLTQMRQNASSQHLELIKFTCMLVMVAHWFACIWAMVAYFEVQSWKKEYMEDSTNWIGSWYENNYTEGGLNPLGWFQDADRYVLSLFWAIQTITSIGYGNISPVTPAEWWIGCILMLFSAIVWAYVIGGIVGVTAAMNARSKIYMERIDQTNAMIKEFALPDTLEDDCRDVEATEEARNLERRIKNYLHNQHTTSYHNACVSDMKQSFPAMETLSPDLQRLSAFMVLKDDLETVPYLSSRFLSIEARSEVAIECVFLEFAAGEVIDIEKGVGHLGRGIFVFQKGIGLFRSHESHFNGLYDLLLPGMTCGDKKVLVEDGHPAVKGNLHFLSFAKVVFIPRKAVLACLAKHPTAWKECARWKYFMAALLSPKKTEIESVLKDDLETVPYLSSRFLNTAARSEVAMECVFLEFAVGEVIDIENGVGHLGRGIFVFQKGLGLFRSDESHFNGLYDLLLPGMTWGDGRVLVEDGHPAVKGSLYFLSFAKVVFIPRKAVLAALAKHPTAWKECARWKYFMAALLSPKKTEMELAYTMGKNSTETTEKEQSAPETVFGGLQ
jgi:hypothetical protein